MFKVYQDIETAKTDAKKWLDANVRSYHHFDLAAGACGYQQWAFGEELDEWVDVCFSELNREPLEWISQGGLDFYFKDVEDSIKTKYSEINLSLVADDFVVFYNELAKDGDYILAAMKQAIEVTPCCSANPIQKTRYLLPLVVFVKSNQFAVESLFDFLEDEEDSSISADIIDKVKSLNEEALLKLARDCWNERPVKNLRDKIVNLLESTN